MKSKPSTMSMLNIICLMALWMVFSLKTFSQQQIINSGWQFSEDRTNLKTVNIPHIWNHKDAFDGSLVFVEVNVITKTNYFFQNKIHSLQFEFKHDIV